MEGEKDSNETCMIHCTDDSTPLVSIQSLQSWETILNAAQIRKDMRVLKVAKQLDDNVFPKIKYHRKQIFTMESSLEKIVNENGGSKQELEGESSNSKGSQNF